MNLSSAQVQQLMQQCMVSGGFGADAGISQQASFAYAAVLPRRCAGRLSRRPGRNDGCRLVLRHAGLYLGRHPAALRRHGRERSFRRRLRAIPTKVQVPLVGACVPL